jgi:hypothetical protein
MWLLTPPLPLRVSSLDDPHGRPGLARPDSAKMPLLPPNRSAVVAPLFYELKRVCRM